MAYELPPLPYNANALEPHISLQTMILHYGKHHQAYVDKLNAVIKGKPYADDSLEAIIWKSRELDDQYLFNNAAQVWNHNFFWHSMMKAPSKPTQALQAAIDSAFDGMDEFKRAFKEAATSEFGSGWAWLVADKNGLKVTSTSDADTPLVHGMTPLICCDVWEHAYYLDYQNERGEFVDAYLDNLINWNFAAQNWEGRMAA